MDCGTVLASILFSSPSFIWPSYLSVIRKAVVFSNDRCLLFWVLCGTLDRQWWNKFNKNISYYLVVNCMWVTWVTRSFNHIQICLANILRPIHIGGKFWLANTSRPIHIGRKFWLANTSRPIHIGRKFWLANTLRPIHTGRRFWLANT